MSATLSAIDRVFQTLVVICVGLIVVSVAADVVARYGLRHSIMFVNELSRLCFIWLTFLVMPLAIGKGLHVAITSLEEKLEARARIIVFRAGILVTAIFLATLFASAIVCIRARTGEAMLTLPLSVSWFFVPVALGAAHGLLHLYAEFVRGERTERVVELEERE